MSYIEDLKKIYNLEIKNWRRRYRELSDDEWVAAVNIMMTWSGKKSWDKEPDIYEKKILKRLNDIATNPISKREKVVLDAGCGYGYLLNKLWKIGFRNLYGLDLSQKCIDICCSRFDFLAAKGYSGLINDAGEGIHLTQGNLANSGYESDSFDLVICTEVLEHVKEPLQVINEIYRILNSGGVVYFSTPHLDRRQAWDHINFFFTNREAEALNATTNLGEYNIINIVDLFKESDFKSFEVELIGMEKFCFITAVK